MAFSSKATTAASGRIILLPRGFRSVATAIPLTGLLLASIAYSPAQTPHGDSSASESIAGSVAPGQSIFGKNGYVEYVVGNLPVVISVPHGGYLRPATIPDRTFGTAGHQDTKTQELAREIIDIFRETKGKVPHVIINRLHRDKLDANRELFDAAQDDPIATSTWQEFHDFIDSAQHAVDKESARSLYVDLHGHRHSWQIVELGYLLVSNQLMMSDRQLDSLAAQPVTSFGQLSSHAGWSPSRLIRGDLSFGMLLQKNGIESVPSPGIPHPDGNPYFSGGYNLEQHSAFSGRKAWGIQVELPTGIREDDARRHAFAVAFVRSALDFLSITGQ
jgi:hypothetical protein